MTYDYKNGKKRIVEILNNNLKIIEKDKLPSDENFTFENAYFSFITGLFIDIRNSSKIFDLENKESTSKMIRSFTSEIIEILRDSSLLREIGIRGDCVYAIYTTPYKEDIYSCYTKSVTVNTFINMLNKLLKEHGFEEIKAGIGISTDKELVIKAGRKGVGINNSVWIGKAVTKASNLSSLGDKNGISRIVISDMAYDNIFSHVENSKLGDEKSWFKKNDDMDYGLYYHGNVIIKEFNDWIKGGMIDD